MATTVNTSELPLGDSAPSALSPVEEYARACRAVTRRLIAADFLSFAVLAAALLVISTIVDFPSGGFALKSGLAFAVSAPVAFALVGLYSSKPLMISPLDEAKGILQGLGLLLIAWFVLGTLVRPESFGRSETIDVLIWLPPALVISLGVRWVVRQKARRRYPERLLIVGAGRAGQRIAERVRRRSHEGLHIAGFVDDEPRPLSESIADIPVLPESAGINEAIAATAATRVVVAFSRTSTEEMLESLRHSDIGRIPVSIVPRYYDVTPPHSDISELDGMPVVDLKSAEFSRGSRLVKRILDLSVASTALVVLAPLFLAVAVAIKIDSRGPVFFRQDRLGAGGVPFRIWKFRTMVDGAEALRKEMAHLNEMEDAGPLFKMESDPRVTGVGRFLRKTSIDELPQLFNVIVGEMSLVGPRPFVVPEAIQIDGWRRRRSDLKPGITGVWQVRGRNDIPFDEMVQLDYMYVANWSVWWDVRLLLKTIPVVLSRRGAS
ncbi:MAG: sugar transferase [Thermoleophilia bacterium]|nr:sugar transferase [Thermoleophilia bacterium]MDH3725210.1 sugar transferase [Thermoleophilia bacterium]